MPRLGAIAVALVLAYALCSLASGEAPSKLQVKGNLDSAGFLKLLASAPGYDAKKSVLKVCRVVSGVFFQLFATWTFYCEARQWMQESLELYSSGWSVPTIDFEFETGKVKLAKGVTLTLTRLRIKRADVGVPIGEYPV
jgi:hypothetical protein